VPGSRPGRARGLLAGLAAPALLWAGPAAAQSTAAPAAVAPAADPVALAIRTQVPGRLRAFYRARGYWPLWVERARLSPAADALVRLVEDARLDGLSPDRYDPERLHGAIAAADGGDPRALVRAELLLSDTLAAFVRDTRAPELRLRYLDPALEPERVAPEQALAQAARAPSLADYVRQMGWMSPIYVDLRRALATAGEGDDLDPGAPPVPAGPALKPGAAGARVAMLRARLGLAPGERFDGETLARVRAFQTARGLKPDGVAGAATLALVNADAAARRDLLRLNLERARLLPSPWTRHVVVDAASARLWYYDGGAEQGTMRVVAGTPETPTPAMAGTLRYATLNPYWNVPVDLVAKRIAPKVIAGQSLTRMGYEALSGWTADATVIDWRTVDWHAVAAGTLQLRVRELPGRGNSMGTVKFMFPNDQGIYLHDTPQKALFAKADRHLSNGCIRLEDAPRLGRWLFGRALTPDGRQPEQHVALDRPVPVYLLYLTASPAGEAIAFPADVYGRDREALASR
jgi:L,D-transpeptidase YcbB